MSRIFISYRRDDSAGYAGRLYDRLAQHFGKDNIFMDIDAIEPGVDFVETIEKAVGSCDVLIVLIGKQWLTITDPSGRPRLYDPGDFVRLEIKTALARNIRVIPVLIQGAAMPQSQNLPDDLTMLTRRNALEISDTRFHEDVDRFIRVLDNVLGVSKPDSVLPQTTPRRLSGGLCLLAGITVSVVLVAIIGVLAYLAEWIGNGEEIDTGASLVTQQATDIPTSTPSSTNTSTMFPTSTDTPDQPTPTSTDSPTATLIPSSTNTAKPPTNTPTPVPTPTDTPKPPTPTLGSISGSSNSESIRVQQGQLLIVANDDGAAVIKLTFGEEEASYQWRYLRTGSVSEQTGEGIVYENYARTPTADGNLIVDLGSDLFIEIEDLRVEWSYSDNTSGWIYYIPGTLEVQVLSERDFETFDLSTVQL